VDDRPLNYFNYFTEVEDAFVRRRGAHTFVSPLDWALIESWKEIGVPLHIVLRAIERAFDAWDARPHRHRRVNSIFYCQQEVESCYGEYRQSLVGAAEDPNAPDADGGAAPAGDDADSPFPRPRVEAYLERVTGDLAAARARADGRGLAGLTEALDRATERHGEIRASLAAAVRLDAEGLERDLTSLEDVILAGLVEHAPAEEVEAARDEAKGQLKSHKKAMDKAIYQQTFDKFVARRLRETYHVPRLSLFFMD
jgi:hypothetical protein